MAGDNNICMMKEVGSRGWLVLMFVLLSLGIALPGEHHVITKVAATTLPTSTSKQKCGQRPALMFVPPHNIDKARSLCSENYKRVSRSQINTSSLSSFHRTGVERHVQNDLAHFVMPSLKMFSNNDDDDGTAEEGRTDDAEKSRSLDDIVLTSLASTEKWIQETLKLGGGSGPPSSSSSEATPGGPRRPSGSDSNNANNPYSRKEVQYECEESPRLVGVMAGIFTKLRSMREMGEEHCEEMQTISASLEGIEKKSRKFQSTLRQTLVVVSPLCRTINNSFDVFDATIQMINQARRDARDYVLDSSSSQQQEQLPEEDEWVTSLNLSHLHPLFYYNENYPGVKNVAKEEEDPKIKRYKEQRKKARQSPYPTVVLEVKASPALPPSTSPMFGGQQLPQDSSLSPPPSSTSRRSSEYSSSSQGVPEEDVRKLEALFGKTAATSTADSTATNVVEEEDAAAMAVDKFSSSIFSPLGQGQNWITENDTGYSMIQPEQNCFEVCPASQVDAVYEYIFRYLNEQSTKEQLPLLQPQQVYILLPNFCSKSATSFEKFTIRLSALLALLRLKEDDNLASQGALEETVLVSDHFHPEHIEKGKRSPLPILSLRWGPVFPEQPLGNIKKGQASSSSSGGATPDQPYGPDDTELGAFQ